MQQSRAWIQHETHGSTFHYMSMLQILEEIDNLLDKIKDQILNEELEIVDTAKQERELAEKDVNEEWRMMSNEEVS